MKYAFRLLLFLALCVAHSAYADQEVNIKLDNAGHSSDIGELTYCNIIVSLHEDYDGQYEVSFQIENTSNDKVLCLFDRPYDKKALKKQSIVYDKSYPSAKEEIQKCFGLPRSCRLSPSDKEEVTTLSSYDGRPFKIILPIYIAKPVKRGRYAIEERVIITLNIEVELKPDEDFLRLSKAAEELIDEINRQTFCSNKNHIGDSAEKLRGIYKRSIQKLIEEIEKVRQKKGYMSSSKKYKEYDPILQKLKSIDLKKMTVESCSNDKVRKRVRSTSRNVHKCKYCNLSLAQIYSKMENCYIDLHNGKKSKGQAMVEADALYSCAMKNKTRPRGSYLSRISDYYRKIKQK